MDDQVFIAIGRQFLAFALEREQLIKALQEAQAKVRELTPPAKGEGL